MTIAMWKLPISSKSIQTQWAIPCAWSIALMTIRKGEVISVIGHSGCGKSTVLTMVAGLNAITDGDVVVAGRQITAQVRLRWPPHPVAAG